MNVKRSFLLGAALALISLPSAALIQPLAINFQGKLVNPATGAPQNGAAVMTFRIFNVPSGGTALWTEANDNVGVVNGVFNVALGTNTALSRDLFLGASAYLEVTVNSVNGVADGTAMTPRQQLVMSPYAFTANQLSDQNEVRLVAGPTYSTFTSAGNLMVPEGVQASTAVFTQVSTFSVISSSGIQIVSGMLDVSLADGINAQNTGIYAASGTFTNWVNAASATITGVSGSAAGLTVSSGLVVQNGTVDVNGAGGISNTYGIVTSSISASTITMIGGAASAGGVLYMTGGSTVSISAPGTAGFRLVSGGSGPPSWDDPTIKTMSSMPLTPHSGAAAVATTSLTTRKVGLFRVAGRLTVNQLSFTVGTVTTAGTMKVCVYSEDGTTKVIDATSGTVAAGANNVVVAGAPVLSSGLYYVAIGCATTCSDTVYMWTTVSVPGFNAATVPAGKEAHEGTVTHTSGTCNATLGTVTPAISSTPMVRFDN